MKCDVLRQYELCYLATPYYGYEGGLDKAYEDAALLSLKLFGMGINNYSPIVYSHHIARALEIDPTDHDFWMAFDQPMMKKCDALIIARFPGWDKSMGVSIENDRFRAQDKDVWHIDPNGPKLVSEPSMRSRNSITDFILAPLVL